MKATEAFGKGSGKKYKEEGEEQTWVQVKCQSGLCECTETNETRYFMQLVYVSKYRVYEKVQFTSSITNKLNLF